MKTQKTSTGYVVCIENTGYPVSLETRKIYRALRPLRDTPKGYIRIIDESGEDYLYPGEFFAPIRLTPKVKNAFSAV